MIKPLPFNCGDQTAPSWLERANVAAYLIKGIAAKAHTKISVGDIGCGDQKLRLALHDQGIACLYYGYDLMPQSESTMQLDVTKENLPREHDVLVMLGVIEYLEALPKVLLSLSSQARHLIVSHVLRKDSTYSAEKRAQLGWINHMSHLEIESLFFEADFVIREYLLDKEGKTMLFKCESTNYRQQ